MSTDLVKDFAHDVSLVVTVYDSNTAQPRWGPWRYRVQAWLDNAPSEALIQDAIDEWASIAGGPDPRKTNDVTLAHYIAAKLFDRTSMTPTAERADPVSPDDRS